MSALLPLCRYALICIWLPSLSYAAVFMSEWHSLYLYIFNDKFGRKVSYPLNFAKNIISCFLRSDLIFVLSSHNILIELSRSKSSTFLMSLLFSEPMLPFSCLNDTASICIFLMINLVAKSHIL